MHIDLSHNAADDLRQLRIADPEAAAAVLVALEQIESDPNVIDKLTTYGNNTLGTSSLNVKPWQSMKPHGNLWRFRILDTPATSYRVVYGYHWQTRQLCILAVVHKEELDYDNPESELGRRILADWRLL